MSGRSPGGGSSVGSGTGGWGGTGGGRGESVRSVGGGSNVGNFAGGLRGNIICKYYKLGTCNLGEKCRFVHTDEDVSTPPTSGGLRRPFLHIVVLFASDPRVMAYARSVQAKFMDCGVDVFVQAELSELGLGVPGATGPLYIKPEHLSTVISASPGDFLIVIGDRNMKNDTCQARRSGKLVEVPVEEQTKVILDAWVSQCGIRVAGSVQESDREVAKLSDEQCFTRLKRLCGVSHVRERVARLRAAVDEVLSWRRPHARGVAPDLVYTEGDQEMVMQLTRSQTSAIRVHRELAEAVGILKALPLLNQAGDPSSPFGLGRGVVVGASYRPSPVEPVKRSTAVCPITLALRVRLLGVLRRAMTAVEELGSDLMEIAGTQCLWSAYVVEYQREVERETEMEGAEGEPRVSSGVPGDYRSGAAARAPTVAVTGALGGHFRTADSADGVPRADVGPVSDAASASASASASAAAVAVAVAVAVDDVGSVTAHRARGGTGTGSGAPGGKRGHRQHQDALSAKAAPEYSRTWVCPLCTLVNSADSARCAVCDADAPLEHPWKVTGRKQRKARGAQARNAAPGAGAGAADAAAGDSAQSISVPRGTSTAVDDAGSGLPQLARLRSALQDDGSMPRSGEDALFGERTRAHGRGSAARSVPVPITPVVVASAPQVPSFSLSASVLHEPPASGSAAAVPLPLPGSLSPLSTPAGGPFAGAAYEDVFPVLGASDGGKSSGSRATSRTRAPGVPQSLPLPMPASSSLVAPMLNLGVAAAMPPPLVPSSFAGVRDTPVAAAAPAPTLAAAVVGMAAPPGLPLAGGIGAGSIADAFSSMRLQGWPGGLGSVLADATVTSSGLPASAAPLPGTMGPGIPLQGASLAVPAMGRQLESSFHLPSSLLSGLPAAGVWRHSGTSPGPLPSAVGVPSGSAAIASSGLKAHAKEFVPTAARAAAAAPPVSENGVWWAPGVPAVYPEGAPSAPGWVEALTPDAYPPGLMAPPPGMTPAFQPRPGRGPVAGPAVRGLDDTWPGVVPTVPGAPGERQYGPGYYSASTSEHQGLDWDSHVRRHDSRWG